MRYVVLLTTPEACVSYCYYLQHLCTLLTGNTIDQPKNKNNIVSDKNPNQEPQAIQKAAALSGFPILSSLSDVLLYLVGSSLPCLILQILHGTLYITWGHGFIKNMTRPMKKLPRHISSHGNKSHVTNSISSMHALEKKLVDYVWELVHKKKQ
jgi:hypothetical protein